MAALTHVVHDGSVHKGLNVSTRGGERYIAILGGGSNHHFKILRERKKTQNEENHIFFMLDGRAVSQRPHCAIIMRLKLMSSSINWLKRGFSPARKPNCSLRTCRRKGLGRTLRSRKPRKRWPRRPRRKRSRKRLQAASSPASPNGSTASISREISGCGTSIRMLSLAMGRKPTGTEEDTDGVSVPLRM